MFLSAYNIYNVFFALATAGLPVALSRGGGRKRAPVRRTRCGAQDVFRRPCVRADTVPAARLARATYLENPDAAPGIPRHGSGDPARVPRLGLRGYCQATAT